MKNPIYNLARLLVAASVAFTLSVASAEADAEPRPDFGDHSSETLTTKAWQALEQRNFDFVHAFTDRCLELYSAQAKEMQAALSERAPSETANTHWALNDVGTSLYIKGQAYEAQGKPEEAIKVYERLVNEFSYAQTFDVRGWFWPPADAAKQRIDVLAFEAL